MTLEQLRIFLAVAEHQHVTKAAAQLNLTQSSVSSAITALETRHAVTLFNRIGRRIELSPEGKAFLTSATAVLAAARSAEVSLADLSSLRAGTLAIFASQTIASFWLPSRIVAYNAAYPAVGLDLQIGNTAESVAAVISGSVDIGLIEGDTPEPKLRQRVIDKDDLVVVVGQKHPWASAPPVLPRDLSTTRWAMREAGSGTRSTFENALAALNFDSGSLDVAFDLPSNEALCAAAATGTLATVVSTSVARPGLDSGALLRMPLEIGGREFRLIQHEDRSISRAATAFLELIERC
uniref:LysR substrate-binding domain-containing protein n=1 Tax=Aminobacter niigataensis TaxID=83265 RepID=UPI002852CE34|nr:LysR substrate-binding domain-containing protein [Aminobacter niigataensis]WMD00126.1 LysR substrate-binding domain-containing protein [Aminobacter niigataensis]